VRQNCVIEGERLGNSQGHEESLRHMHVSYDGLLPVIVAFANCHLGVSELF
jgi:hypothetical protein